MNKLFTLTAFCLTFSLFCSGQIKKGDIQLGGILSISRTSEEFNPFDNAYTNWYFNINPSFGFTIKDNTVLGVRGNYRRNFNKFPPGYSQKDQTYGGGLFLRKYGSIGKGFFVFGDAGADYGETEYKTRYDLVSYSMERKSGGLNFYPGLSYAAGKRLLLELSMMNLISFSYNSDKIFNSTPSGPSNSETKTVDLSMNASASNIAFGFRFIL